MANQEILEKIKSIIKNYYKSGSLGLYFVSGSPFDERKTLYSKDGVVVKLCYYYEYFEVLGLPNEQCVELLDFYNDLAFESEVDKEELLSYADQDTM